MSVAGNSEECTSVEHTNGHENQVHGPEKSGSGEQFGADLLDGSHDGSHILENCPQCGCAHGEGNDGRCDNWVED